VELGWVSSWIVAVIIARELVVSGVRLAAVESEQKIVISAGFSGKLKTAFTMLAIIVILLFAATKSTGYVHFYNCTIPTVDILMYICAGLTVISGIQYIWNYRGVFKEQK